MGKDGGSKWRQFGSMEVNKGNPEIIYAADPETPEGRPGRPTEGPWDSNIWKEDQIIPYTPARWAALLRISWMITEIHEKLNAIVEEGTGVQFLDLVAQKGMYALLAPEKDKGK